MCRNLDGYEWSYKMLCLVCSELCICSYGPSLYEINFKCKVKQY